MPRERKHPDNSSEKNAKISKKKKYVSTGVSLLKINNQGLKRPVEINNQALLEGCPAHLASEKMLAQYTANQYGKRPVENKENNGPLVKTAKTINPLKERLLLSNNPVQEKAKMTKSVVVVVIDGPPASMIQERLKNPTPVQERQNTATSVPVHFTINPVQEKSNMTKTVISMKPAKSVVIDRAPASMFQERQKTPTPIQERQHTSTTVPVHFTAKLVQETPKITKSVTSMKPQKSMIDKHPVAKYQEKLKKFTQLQERPKNAYAPGRFSRPEKRTQPSTSIQERQKLSSSYPKKSKPANSLQERQKSLSSIHETPKPANSSQDRSQLENAANIQNLETGLKSEILSWSQSFQEPSDSMPILFDEEVNIKETPKNTYSYEERPKANNSSKERPPPLASYQEKNPMAVAAPIGVAKGAATPIGGATVGHGHPSKELEPVGVATSLKEDLQGPNKKAIDAREKAQRERKGKYWIVNLLKKCNFEICFEIVRGIPNLF